jgi:hypothetical protein
MCSMLLAKYVSTSPSPPKSTIQAVSPHRDTAICRPDIRPPFTTMHVLTRGQTGDVDAIVSCFQLCSCSLTLQHVLRPTSPNHAGGSLLECHTFPCAHPLSSRLSDTRRHSTGLSCTAGKP